MGYSHDATEDYPHIEATHETVTRRGQLVTSDDYIEPEGIFVDPHIEQTLYHESNLEEFHVTAHTLQEIPEERGGISFSLTLDDAESFGGATNIDQTREGLYNDDSVVELLDGRND